MQNHNNAIKTTWHSSFRKNIPLTLLKGSCWWPNKDCNILNRPQLFWLSQPFFPILLDCSTGGLGPQPLLGHGSHSSIFSPTDLNFLSPWLYNNLTSTYFLRSSQFRIQFNLSTVKVSPDLLISLTECTCHLHRCISSFDSMAGSEVNIEHVSSSSFDYDMENNYKFAVK